MRAPPLLTCALLLNLAAALPASAQDAPPARVGRVSLVDGDIRYRPDGGDWSDALVNLPVATGTELRSQGRGEVEVGGDVVALSVGTEVAVARLADGLVQIALRQGRIGVELRRLAAGDSVEIDTPRGGVWLLASGRYDIAVGSGKEPDRVAVVEGRARFVGAGDDTGIAAGSTAILTGDTAVAARFGPLADDDFALWWRSQARPDLDSAALLHLSPEMTGADALDGAGHWEAVPGLGAAWFPEALPADWAPYRHGRWRWVPPWGWTWIDDAAWGFAPSHFGRWLRVVSPSLDIGPGGERWAWAPGAVIEHPVYAPALVGFIGTPGIGLSYADSFTPAVAWFPLAPGEVYWPEYPGGPDAIRRVNAGSVRDVAAIPAGVNGAPPVDVVAARYRNRLWASAVPRSMFLAGKPVAVALVDIPGRRLENAPLIAGSPQIPPAATRPIAAIVAAMARGAGAPPPVANAAAPIPRDSIAAPYLRFLARVLAKRGAHAMHAVALSSGPRRGVALPVRPVAAPVATSRPAGGRRHLAAMHGPKRSRS